MLQTWVISYTVSFWWQITFRRGYVLLKSTGAVRIPALVHGVCDHGFYPQNDRASATAFCLYTNNLKMSSGAHPNGQQQQDVNQQYAQPLQQQFTGAPTHGYIPIAEQSPLGSTPVQQGFPQPLNQSPMPQVPTYEPLSTAQPQQPFYQQYYQGHGNVAQTPSIVAGSWPQTLQPNAQWQNAANSATTTTTTTTTTKITKEMQASRPEYAASSTVSDFASLMQQAPQQQ
jgi:hypothetical protein